MGAPERANGRRGAEFERRRREDRGAEGSGGVGRGVPLLTEGGIWGGAPQKKIDFGCQIGEFWCKLGVFLVKFT